MVSGRAQRNQKHPKPSSQLKTTAGRILRSVGLSLSLFLPSAHHRYPFPFPPIPTLAFISPPSQPFPMLPPSSPSEPPIFSSSRELFSICRRLNPDRVGNRLPRGFPPTHDHATGLSTCHLSGFASLALVSTGGKRGWRFSFLPSIYGTVIPPMSDQPRLVPNNTFHSARAPCLSLAWP